MDKRNSCPHGKPAARRCNLCCARYARDWRAKNPEKAKATHKRYRDRHPEHIAKMIQKSNEKRYERHRLQRYGLTKEEYDGMLGDQGGVCVICKAPDSGRGGREGQRRRLAVDHNHTNGKVRGLLCINCNSGLGQFKDNPELCRRAAEYLSQ